MNISQAKKKLFVLSRWQKRMIMICADLIMIPFALWASFAMRHGSWTPPLQDGVWLLLVAPLLSIPVFIRLGLYRAVVRFLGNEALVAVVTGISVSVIALLLTTILFDLQGIPRSVYIIYWGTALLLVGGSRHFVRRLYHHANNNNRRTNVAIYGAGHSGAELAQALISSSKYRPVLFVDDDLALQKSFIHGLKIHSPSELSDLIERYQLKQLLLAMPSVELRQRREVLHRLEHLPIHVRTIPAMADLVAGSSVEEIQEIEIDDLLGRTPVAPDSTLISKCITDKSVMVTGAGGSIGSELCRQIVRQAPKKLILFEVSEFSLYQIERELIELCRHESCFVEIIPVLGSVQHQVRVSETIKQYTVQTLYHAAAYKHVPLVEQNPVEGLQNNALGTYRTAYAAYKSKVEYFVLISTDKAVRPTNVMGASKRMAELSLQALAQLEGDTVFTMVRFGNVLGSSGSVVPLFRQQIKAGGPITITHPDIIRYFMTIPEAAQLVIQAGAMAKGGEVFLLDMGKPVKIVDLAKRMIRLSGLKERNDQYPEGDIALEYTGLRPGEKLYEELLIDGDASSTLHPRIFHAHEEKVSWDEYQEILDNLTTACNRRDVEYIYGMLRTYVSGFKPDKKNSGELIKLPLAVSRPH
ncbi:MAG: polysaccharide biosynthesis protein [Proteobacteria bacterium]|nr:MAG: polysaccharide biosynthesis protein [Pseudomonadota bacterium]